MKKNTILVLVVILIPIIILGSLAVNGASNIQEEQNETGPEENQTSIGGIIAPLHITTMDIQIPLLIANIATG